MLYRVPVHLRTLPPVSTGSTVGRPGWVSWAATIGCSAVSTPTTGMNRSTTGTPGSRGHRESPSAAEPADGSGPFAAAGLVRDGGAGQSG